MEAIDTLKEHPVLPHGFSDNVTASLASIVKDTVVLFFSLVVKIINLSLTV
jgi:hypothetical protein